MQMRTLIGASVLGVVAVAGSAQATIIATDSYTNGSNPSAGQYAATSIATQPGLVTTGFATNGYVGGAGTTNFTETATGLSSIQFNGGGGQVNWLGLSATAPVQNRTNARALSTSQNLTTYYTSQILHLDTTTGTSAGTVGSFVGLGFTNALAPLASPGQALTGFYIGYTVTSATDTGSLTIRSRTTTGVTVEDTVLLNGTTAAVAGNNYEVVTRSDGTSGIDSLQYWINPVNTTSEATMTATSLASGTIANYGQQLGGSGSADLQRLTFGAVGTTASTGIFQSSAEFDEVRLGTTLADVVPEPTTLAAVAGAGLTLFRRRRRA